MLAFVRELTPRPEMESAAGVMHLGIAIHFSLEAYYGHEIDPLGALKWEYDSVIAEHPLEEVLLAKEYELAKVMLEGYLDWVSAEGFDAAVDVIGTEMPVQHDVTVPGTTDAVTIRGRFDQLVRRKSDGRIVIRDFKTVGGMMKGQTLRLSSQMKFYTLVQSLAAREKGEQMAAGGEYLLIMRSKRTDRAHPPFYSRVEVPVNRHDLNAQYMQTLEIVREIEEARKQLDAGVDHHRVAYPHFTDACSYSCQFLQLCGIMDDGSRWEDKVKADFVRQDTLSYYSDDKIKALKSALPIQ